MGTLVESLFHHYNAKSCTTKLIATVKCVTICGSETIIFKLEAKDVLPNINHTQAAERVENAFLSLVTLTLTFKLVRARDRGRLPCEFGANSFRGSRDISYTNKNTD